MDVDFDEWMSFGIEKGWCGPPVCNTHDGLPLSETEYDLEDECIHIIRLYDDKEMKDAVEENHSPSHWRDIYTK
jgi:hypothetical protein